jgi:hypothetical protein
MITLGLTKQVFSKPSDPSPNLSNPPQAVLQALSETAAWCSRAILRSSELRSRELDPSVSLKVPPFDALGIEAWLKIKRESYQRAMDAIVQRRSILLRDESTAITDVALAQSKGRLLLYEPMETVTDGAAAVSSGGFFDLEDAPPWDTWFLYSEGTIFSWVPDSMIQHAQAGIDANPVDCIHWAPWCRLSGQRDG